MFAFFLALGALAGAMRADCDACIAGRCHSRTTIISGFPITDQMAIDRTDNILYLQLNGDLNMAFSIDHPEIRLINMMKTTGMVVDQESSMLYLGTKEIPRTFYKYDPANNTTAMNGVNALLPDLQDYSGNNNQLFMMGASEWHYTYLKNFTISGLVVDKYNGMVYFVSNNTLYVLDDENRPPRAILRRGHMVLSADSAYVLAPPYSDTTLEVYIGDATEKIIYKLDSISEELIVYAAYKTGTVAEFMFGRNNQMISRDVDGSVVLWVPTRGHEGSSYGWSETVNSVECAVDPPSTSFSVRQLKTTKC